MMSAVFARQPLLNPDVGSQKLASLRSSLAEDADRVRSRADSVKPTVFVSRGWSTIGSLYE